MLFQPTEQVFEFLPANVSRTAGCVSVTRQFRPALIFRHHGVFEGCRMPLLLLSTLLRPELVQNHINITLLAIETRLDQMLSFLSCCLKIRRRAQKWREIEGSLITYLYAFPAMS